MVCLANCLAELPTVYLGVNPMVEFGMAKENQVVNGHYTLHTTLTDANGKLARESVKHLNAVAFQVFNDSP